MRLLLFFWILCLMSCQNPRSVDIQGHRGCRGLMPENTLPAFKKAIDIGVHTLELDVVITKDKKVVVSHEPYFNNIICLDAEGNEMNQETGKNFNIYQMTYEEVKRFDCGSKPHKLYPEQLNQKAYKPLLREVIKLAEEENSNIKYNIELKTHPDYYGEYTPFPEEFVSLVFNELEQSGILDRANLQSFDLITLEQIKKHSTSIPVALLVGENEEIITKLSRLSFKPEIISPSFKLLDAKKVKNLQLEDYEVIPWTVNKTKDLQLMLDYEVDGIITDYPNRLIELIQQ